MKYKYMICMCLVSIFMLQACLTKEIPPEQLEEKTESASSELPTQTSDTTKPTLPVEPEKQTVPLSERINENDLKAYFEEYDHATMLLTDGNSSVAYNEDFSEEPHPPFSTFKIPNSLIALEEGVVSIEDSLRKWDGVEYNRQELNQDQDMASAMKHSCLWYYKQLANDIGNEAMQSHINNIQYGNMDLTGGIDTFWLGTSLLISPAQQLDFIMKLYHNELPFQQENMDYVKSILKQDAYPFDLYGKTGSSGDGMGWFVGYALLEEKPIFFAAYMEGESASGLIARDVTAQMFEDLFID